MPESIEAWVSLWGKFYRVFIKQTQKKTSNHSNSLLALCQECVEWEQSDPEWKGVDNKVEEQPWSQLVHCASICCYMCGCVFQEDRIVVRRSEDEWYIDW